MPVIFISRGTMSGVHQVLNLLQQRISIRCISREDLEKKVNQHGKIATKVLEKLPEAVTDYEQFSKLKWPFLVLMRNALLEEISDGDVIYHGYSGHLLLPHVRHFIRLRIHAPISLRVPMTMERLSCNEKEARTYISNSDEQKIKWARFIYAKDIRNPLLYDLCINLEHISLNATCAILESLLAMEDFQSTNESVREVERLKLISEIEKKLVIDPRTANLEIKAEVKGNMVNLIGPYLEKNEREVVLEVARSVPGVKEVCYSPGYKQEFECSNALCFK